MNTVVVTGAAGAIGSAVVKIFARQGMRVHLLDNDAARLEKVCASLASDGVDLVAKHCDVTCKQQVDGIFQAIEKEGNLLLGLVNSAAIVNHHAHLLDLKEQDWDRIVAVNLKGMFLCSQAAAGIMAKQRKGAIVNLGSLSSRRVHREQAAYDATKGAIEAFTRAAALDLAPYEIRVNALLPAVIATDTMVQHAPDDFRRKEQLVPLGRYGKPEEVAEVCEFLICRATFITGQCIIIDGGLDAQLRPLELEYVESARFGKFSAG